MKEVTVTFNIVADLVLKFKKVYESVELVEINEVEFFMEKFADYFERKGFKVGYNNDVDEKRFSFIDNFFFVKHGYTLEDCFNHHVHSLLDNDLVELYCIYNDTESMLSFLIEYKEKKLLEDAEKIGKLKRKLSPNYKTV